MTAARPSSTLSWWMRAALGAVIGGLVGLLQIVDGLSLVGVASAAVAGAIFGSVVGVLAIHVARNRFSAVLLGAFAGGLAGLGWAAIRSSVLAMAIAGGVLLGGLLCYLEFPGAADSSSVT
jgi:hypothetical protein